MLINPSLIINRCSIIVFTARSKSIKLYGMRRQAVILAGGKGTRLRPFTTTLPKPLVPVGDYPIIEVVARQLKHFGFRQGVVSTGHLAELIEAYCGDGRRWGLKIRYVREDKPLNTAGALKLIRGLKS